MKGYKIGINGKPLNFVLIELEVPEAYPGAIVYEHKYEMALSQTIYPFSTRSLYRTVTQYRSNVARVLNIRKIKDGIPEYVESAFSLYDYCFYYYPGEIIYPDTFDTDPDRICTNGIHFFDTVEEAIRYTKDDWARYRYDCKVKSIIKKRGVDF